MNLGPVDPVGWWSCIEPGGPVDERWCGSGGPVDCGPGGHPGGPVDEKLGLRWAWWATVGCGGNMVVLWAGGLRIGKKTSFGRLSP